MAASPLPSLKGRHRRDAHPHLHVEREERRLLYPEAGKKSHEHGEESGPPRHPPDLAPFKGIKLSHVRGAHQTWAGL